MNRVLYTLDLEPITVVDVPQALWEHTKNHGYANIAVKQLPVAGAPPDLNPPDVLRLETRRAIDETGNFYEFLVTPHETIALLLNPQWLPGQLQWIQHTKRVINLQQEEIKRLQ